MINELNLCTESNIELTVRCHSITAHHINTDCLLADYDCTVNIPMFQYKNTFCIYIAIYKPNKFVCNTSSPLDSYIDDKKSWCSELVDAFINRLNWSLKGNQMCYNVELDRFIIMNNRRRYYMTFKVKHIIPFYNHINDSVMGMELCLPLEPDSSEDNSSYMSDDDYSSLDEYGLLR